MNNLDYQNFKKILFKGTYFIRSLPNMTIFFFNAFNLNTLFVSLKIYKKSFDRILLVVVIEYFRSLDKVLKKIYSLFQNNGQVFINTHRYNSLKYFIYGSKWSEIKKKFDLMLFDKKNLVLLLVKSRFRQIEFVNSYQLVPHKNFFSRIVLFVLCKHSLGGRIDVIAKK